MPYLPIHGHRGLVLFCLPVPKQAQVILVLQLRVGEPGLAGTVGVAFHHLSKYTNMIHKEALSPDTHVTKLEHLT